ncbi:MAG TPA: MBL fold metallo-hydrolase [Baekduia sp.]|jgi:glyoxylase-like metal-dependent hydrolase (beta-lactamase superfamily II)
MTDPHGVHALAIPTPFKVGRVNCYLIDDDPLTLVDAGPNSGTALTALEAKLGEHGRRIEDLERIVLTHQHIDHIGLAQILADRSGADVVALAALAPWLATSETAMSLDDQFAESVMLRNGVPHDVGIALRAVTEQYHAWGAAVQVTQPVSDGDLLEFADRSWRVLHRPGHSPSDTVFHDEATGVLLGGDHLIKHISSNPLITRPLGGGAPEDRPKALITYMASLTATRVLDLQTIYAGHGDPVEDHRTLIDDRFTATERRLEHIADILAADGPKSGYEIAQEMWGNVAVTQAYLTLSEVLGHIDLLLERDEVVPVDDGDVLRFAPSS